MNINKDGLAKQRPIGTKKYVRCKAVRDTEVHSGDIETVRSQDLDVD